MAPQYSNVQSKFPMLLAAVKSRSADSGTVADMKLALESVLLDMPSRIAWMQVLCSITDGRYPTAAILSESVVSGILQSGLDGLSELELFDLAMNPCGLSQLAAEIMQEPTDFWWDRYRMPSEHTGGTAAIQTGLRQLKSAALDSQSESVRPLIRTGGTTSRSPFLISLSLGSSGRSDEDDSIAFRTEIRVSGIDPASLTQRLVRVSNGCWTLFQASEATLRFEESAALFAGTPGDHLVLQLSFPAGGSCERVGKALEALCSGLCTHLQIGHSQVPVAANAITEELRRLVAT